MASRNRRLKRFRLDAVKVKRVQRILGAATQTEAIERALDFAISECESHRLTLEGHDRFAKSGIRIKDVYGALES